MLQKSYAHLFLTIDKKNKIRPSPKPKSLRSAISRKFRQQTITDSIQRKQPCCIINPARMFLIPLSRIIVYSLRKTRSMRAARSSVNKSSKSIYMALRSKYFTFSFLCLYILQEIEILSTRILRDTLTRVVFPSTCETSQHSKFAEEHLHNNQSFLSQQRELSSLLNPSFQSSISIS